MRAEAGRPRRTAALLLATLAILAAAILINARFRTGGEQSGDAGAYLRAGHNLAHHGVFGQEAPGVAGLGREPGYGLLLAGLMRTTALAAFRPDCLDPARPCPPAIYRPAQIANLVLALAAAALLGWVAWSLTGWAWAGVIGFGYLALNAQALRGRWELLSDQLALFLVVAVMAALLHWLRRPGAAPAVLAGLALAALALTKAVFLYALLGLLLAGIGLLALRRVPRGAAWFCLAALLPLALWSLRNQLVAGTWALTDARSGIALSTREVFLHMDAQQIACAFVYWTRGVGDGLAAALFPAAVWQPFQLDWPGGYYDVGQNRYMPWVARVAAEQGLGAPAAQAAVDRALLESFLAHPLGWLASLPALIWRGLWIDEFVVLGFPALVAGTLWAARRGEAAWLLLFGLGWFNLVFYAAISLNVPRYQITAVPALALAAPWLAWRVAEVRKLRQSRSG